MKLLALLAILELPLAALAYTAVHLHATGADYGVLWLIGFLTVVAGLVAVGARSEIQASQPAPLPSRALQERGNL